MIFAASIKVFFRNVNKEQCDENCTAGEHVKHRTKGARINCDK